MKLQMVGCSHHHSSIEVRERLVFNNQQATAALDLWREQFPEIEAVLISTCNRTELYTAGPDFAPSHRQIAEFLTSFHGLNLDDTFDDLIGQQGTAAVRHLFTVAASMDSMVLGEAQILSQVKTAYELARSKNLVGPITHDVFQAALRVARRIARDTTINERRVSVASVAVSDFAKRIFEQFGDKHVLVIGAGETADETLRYLVDEGARQFTVLNRSFERAQRLAGAWGGRAAPWSALPVALVEADLIVSATSSEQPIVRLEDYVRIEHDRFQRPLLILDLAAPRDFDPAIGKRLDVYLYSIDDLRETCDTNRRARRDQWPQAEQIIEEETEAFMAQLYHRATAPAIRRLRDNCDEIKQDELRRLLNKLAHLSAADADEIDRAFERLVNKLLHPPLESLRDESRHGPPHGLIDALKRLFHLKD